MDMKLVICIGLWFTLLHGCNGDSENMEMKAEVPDYLMRSVRGTGNKMDIIFIVDASLSISIKHFAFAKNFMLGIVNLLLINPESAQIGVVKFGPKIYDEFSLSTYWNQKQVKEAILGMDRDDITHVHTRTDVAINNMVRMFQGDGRKDAGQVCIIITDGNSMDFGLTKNAADDAREKNIKIFAIANGYPEKVNSDGIKAIGGTKSVEYSIASTTDLEINMEGPLSSPLGSLKSRADVLFVVDNSIDELNLGLGKTFLINVMKQLTIDPDHVRVGIITFSNGKSAQEVLRMTEGDSLGAVEKAIERIETNDEKKPLRNCAQAIKTMIAAFIKDGHLLSIGIPRIAVLLTDGMLTGKINNHLGRAEPIIVASALEMANAVAAPHRIFPYAVSMGHEVDQVALNVITGAQSRHFQVSDVTKLAGTIASLGKNIKF